MKEYKGIERRICRRFEVPGATASYRLKKAPSSEKETDESWDEEFCPVENMSCGGIRYAGKKPLTINSDITVKILIPGERTPLIIHGQVRWLSTEEDIEVCRTGIQFNPYGEGEGKNYPGLMVKLLELEHKFATPESDITNYEIDS
ncbi:MAG: PilZ domain-containing protein [Candidatus Aminicenantes bacterium]|nr:MAG: PilZ domain-containing protein [Candidatus Aminicenantes bacterium]